MKNFNERWSMMGLIVGCLIQPSLMPAAITFQSSARQTSLVELYTSEGCSSCPSADAWLSRLKASPGLWKQFVPVAFHVDYWDHLGWRDPWSSKEFSLRQQAYAAAWNRETVYTPGFVLQGKEWRGWAGHREPLSPSAAPAGVLSVVSVHSNRWQVVFRSAAAREKPYEVHAALLGAGLASEVKAGENRGRRLLHDFVVLNLVKASLTNRGSVCQGEFVLSPNQNRRPGGLALAAWVTEPGRLEPLQATGGWLTQ